MSHQLLSSVSLYLSDAGLLAGLSTKYYRWMDADLKGSADFVLFRMAGSSGPRNATLQQPDIKLIIVGKESGSKDANDKADAIFAKFADTDAPANMIKIEPLATVLGPYFLDNGRCAFEINARCFVQDM